ncbi:MAG: M23 family metallopeptidase [Bacteroidota bacterium]
MKRKRFILAGCAAAIAASLSPPPVPGRAPAASHQHPSSAFLRTSDSITTDLSDYLWPTDAGNIITSTFAEYRPMHFHAGIDISTGDVTGYRVYAMRDGEVRRIRIYPNGYGKILYIRHPDGYTTAYAHLSRFAGALEEMAEREQLRLEQYPIDLRLAPGTFPVKKGDLVAYTGDTGIGSPHLHVEIRDPNDEPINPQLSPNLRAPDLIPPVIHGLAVIPRGDRSTVQGAADSRVVTLTHTGASSWKVSRPIIVSGRAGFAIDVRDRTADERFYRGIYRLRLAIDGNEFFESVHNRAPLEDAQSVGIAYDWRLGDQRKAHFEKMFVDVPGILPFYSPAGRDAGMFGTGILSQGKHAFSIIADDIAGNTAEVQGTLVITEPPLFTVEREGSALTVRIPNPEEIAALREDIRTPSGEWIHRKIALSDSPAPHLLHLDAPREEYSALKFIAENAEGVRSAPKIIIPEKIIRGPATMAVSHSLVGDAIHVTVRCRGVFTTPPIAVVGEGSSIREVVLDLLDADAYEGIVHLKGVFSGTCTIEIHAQVNGEYLTGKDSCEAYPILPGMKGAYRFDNDRLEIRYDSTSVFSPVFLQVESEGSGDSPSYVLSPRMAVLRDGLRVRVRMQVPDDRAGLYFRGRGGLRYIGAAHSPTDTLLEGRITQTLGSLQVRHDNTPPSIRGLSLHVDPNRTVRVSFRLRDDLSGVEYESVKLYIDKTFVVPDIDGEHHRIRYQSSDPLEGGTHHFLIRCHDRAGNICTVERSFRVK